MQIVTGILDRAHKKSAKYVYCHILQVFANFVSMKHLRQKLPERGFNVCEKTLNTTFSLFFIIFLNF